MNSFTALGVGAQQARPAPTEPVEVPSGTLKEDRYTGRYGLPQRPERVNGWLIGFGIVLMCVAALGAAAAVAVVAMQPK